MSPDALHGCKDHLFDRMEARLTCYDRERRILWVNAYAASMAGSSPEDLVGVSCCRAWQNCSQPFQKCHVIQALESGLPKSVELDTPDGRSWFLTAYPMQGPDGRVEIVGEYGRDVTEEKRNQQLRDEINAITRHDLKGPAINAVTVAKLLDRGDNLTDTQRELLHELRHSGEHMLEIINQTLVLHKIDKGTYEPELETVDCRAVIHDVARYFSKTGRADKDQVVIRVQGEEESEAPCPIRAEQALLRTSLTNLVKNALEASPPGEKVFVDLEPGEDIRIRIWNKGAVPPSIRDRFFTKYATAGKKKGTGLGAYSAKQLLTVQGASVDMETTDEDGGSTTLTIVFPGKGARTG